MGDGRNLRGNSVAVGGVREGICCPKSHQKSTRGRSWRGQGYGNRCGAYRDCHLKKKKTVKLIQRLEPAIKRYPRIVKGRKKFKKKNPQRPNTGVGKGEGRRFGKGWSAEAGHVLEHEKIKKGGNALSSAQCWVDGSQMERMANKLSREPKRNPLKRDIPQFGKAVKTSRLKKRSIRRLVENRF